MKKKVVFVALSLALALSLCACSTSDSGSGNAESKAGTSSTQSESSENKTESSAEDASVESKDTEASPADEKLESKEAEEPTKTEYNIGETWTVDGQWSLVVNSVSETKERNEYAETEPAAVYIVDYTYKNLGYVDDSGAMDGIFFGMDDSIVDSAGVMGSSYPGDVEKYAQEAPVGATCNAQSCIGVENAGSFKINVVQYDGNGNKQTATFNVAVSE